MKAPCASRNSRIQHSASRTPDSQHDNTSEARSQTLLRLKPKDERYVACSNICDILQHVLLVVAVTGQGHAPRMHCCCSSSSNFTFNISSSSGGAALTVVTLIVVRCVIQILSA
jgi:hypothetical protein